MRDVELPDEREQALNEPEPEAAPVFEATEQGSAKHHEWAAREDNSGEASSLAAQREARPTDEAGNTVLSQAEIDEADGISESDGRDAEPDSQARI